MTASEYYVKKLLKEKPTHTKGGVKIEIKDGGNHVVTRTGRAWNRRGYSVYNPCDYPALFGWDTYGKLFDAQKKIIEAVSNGEKIEIVRRRPRPFGLTVEQLHEFNRVCESGEKRIVWHAPKWVAMDRKSYDRLINKANTNDTKIFLDEVPND